MEKLVEKIGAELDNFKADVAKQLDGNKAAGMRARKSSMALTKLFKTFRKESVKFTK